MKLIRRVLALALATTSWAAAAAQHQICFESEMLQSLPTATWGCRDDAGGSCTITPLFAGTALGTTVSGNPPGTFDVRQLPNAGSFSARFDFYDAAGAFVVSRTCSVNSVSPFGMRGAASRSSEPSAAIVIVDPRAAASSRMPIMLLPSISRRSHATVTRAS